MNESRAFTKWDLLICLATVAMLVMALPLLPSSGCRGRAPRINCVSNLKQVALGFRMWANDHGDRFPWELPAADGGAREFAHAPFAALHFTLASNELNHPKILTCPSDTNRTRTNTWGTLASSLSYFAGISATVTNPAGVLSGDRNISTNSSILEGLLTIQNSEDVQWTADMHKHAGNIAFADGSVQQVDNKRLRNAFQAALDASENRTVRLAIP
jgi:prepilin-type processing-associated H-X9-DG protein